MRKSYTFFICFLLALSNYAVAQSELTITVNDEIKICGTSKISTITIVNASGVTYSNVLFNIALPAGIYYQSGRINESTSYNVTENNISNNAALTFNANDLVTGDSIKFDIYFTAKMDAITFQDGGGVFRNNITFYSDQDTLTEESDSYNILYPVMSILSVSPTSQTFISGSSTTRTISVINGGNGKTSAN